MSSFERALWGAVAVGAAIALTSLNAPAATIVALLAFLTRLLSIEVTKRAAQS
jgi:xanthosine utilization system XapX-like protein